MTSKEYFNITKIFMLLYIITTLGVIIGIPDWIHQCCTVIFVGALWLEFRKKKQENEHL